MSVQCPFSVLIFPLNSLLSFRKAPLISGSYKGRKGARGNIGLFSKSNPQGCVIKPFQEFLLFFKKKMQEKSCLLLMRRTFSSLKHGHRKNLISVQCNQRTPPRGGFWVSQ